MVVETPEAPDRLKGGTDDEAGSAGRTLIFGGTGRLGRVLERTFPDSVSIGHTVPITDKEGVRALVERVRPALVLNAAAWTDVDACETDPERALLVNGEGPGYIAAACEGVGATLVHFSTDYIFSGDRTVYYEDDPPSPINTYGRTKALGERRVMIGCHDYRIIRTSRLFGPFGENFVTLMQQRSAAKRTVMVIDDEVSSPTYTLDLAGMVPVVVRAPPGIYHVTNSGSCSWYEFAAAVIRNAVPVHAAQCRERAPRPRSSVLCSRTLPPLRPWQHALGEYLHEQHR
jgi:dTDP-4-dehydrorhamnose reductase